MTRRLNLSSFLKKTPYHEEPIQDPIALKIGKLIHDFEIDAEENPEKVKFKETLGLCYVLKGMERTSRTDDEIVEKGLVVLDALCASLTDKRETTVVRT